MKIGIYSPYLDTLTGGERYMLTVASCLAKEHEVFIFWDDFKILESASEKFGLNLENVKITTDIFGTNRSKVKRLIESTKYDRIFYLSDGSIPIVNCKLLIHFQFPVEWLDTNSFSFLIKKSRISKIICNSYFTKKFIDRKFNVESSVLYPPANVSVEELGIKERSILTVGRFSKLQNNSDFKKLGFMVESFKKFQKKRLKGWHFNIVTSVRQEDRKEFENFVKSIKSEYIKVYANADHKTIGGLYDQAMIYWHAAGFGEDLSLHPERAEHFGISTVEAMSHGSVPVVINAGGQMEIVKEGENGFLWDTQEQLIKKTHRLATNKELYGSLQKEAIESSRRFTQDRFCEELNHLIW